VEDERRRSHLHQNHTVRGVAHWKLGIHQMYQDGHLEVRHADYQRHPVYLG